MCSVVEQNEPSLMRNQRLYEVHNGPSRVSDNFEMLLGRNLGQKTFVLYWMVGANQIDINLIYTSPVKSYQGNGILPLDLSGLINIQGYGSLSVKWSGSSNTCFHQISFFLLCGIHALYVWWLSYSLFFFVHTDICCKFWFLSALCFTLFVNCLSDSQILSRSTGLVSIPLTWYDKTNAP